MKSEFDKILDRALEEPTLIKAMSFIALWESERAIQQARRFYETGIATGHYGGWDTCFEFSFKELINRWNKKNASNTCSGNI